MKSKPSGRARLTEHEWEEVFRARCLSKRGQRLTEAEQAWLDRAFREDPKRYSALDARVFNATVPFGSAKRVKED